MRSRRAAFLALLLVAGPVAALLIRKSAKEPGSTSHPTKSPRAAETSAEIQRSSTSSTAESLIGVRIVQGYGAPSQTPEQDLTALAHLMENFTLLVKGDRPLVPGANEEIAAALRGSNRTQLRMLPDDSPAFNQHGQIIDRWSTPVYFHANSSDQIDIRSAGPDRQMWTADDIHRRHNGRFLRGEALLAPSLFEATTGRSAPPHPREK